MAGRGVDIVLGGNPPDSEKARQVREVGGLCVIGTERHEARRIDNQLRGRGGRQGDPGETRFFVSLEDDLMRIFGSERIKKMMETFHIPEDQPISHSMVSRAIEAAQAKIEGFNFDIRKHVLEYDDVMNIQRRTIYRKRREIMESENLKKQILNMVGEQIAGMVNFHTAGLLQEWNLEEIAENIKALIPLPSDLSAVVSTKAEILTKEGRARPKLRLDGAKEGSPTDLHQQIQNLADPKKSEIEIRNNIIDYLADLARNAYEEKEKEVGGENMRQIEKILSLRTIDMLWMDHLENMEYLRDSVRLRAYGQQDPLVEYKNEGHRLFKELMTSIEANIVGTIFKVGLVKPQTQMAAETNRGNQNSVSQKTGRNDPCPCGSGKKYKKCHGA
jgi:preprotein translocase subunit SecA